MKVVNQLAYSFLFGLVLVAGAALDAKAVVNFHDDDDTVTLGRGAFVLVAPMSWEKQEPRSSILEAEFAAPAKEDGADSARVTFMAAGGGVEPNIDRWISQFSQPDGSSTRDKTKIDVIEVDGSKVHLVDLTGSFTDRPRGPRGPAVNRDGYRMLAAIVESETGGLYFIKMVGPAPTVETNAEPFRAMVESIKFK